MTLDQTAMIAEGDVTFLINQVECELMWIYWFSSSHYAIFISAWKNEQLVGHMSAGCQKLSYSQDGGLHWKRLNGTLLDAATRTHGAEGALALFSGGNLSSFSFSSWYCLYKWRSVTYYIYILFPRVYPSTSCQFCYSFAIRLTDAAGRMCLWGLFHTTVFIIYLQFYFESSVSTCSHLLTLPFPFCVIATDVTGLLGNLMEMFHK